MAECKDCKRIDVKCCSTCRNANKNCQVTHKCGKDCVGYEPFSNADRIRSMTDEDLAMNMMCPNENGLAEIYCNRDDSCNCYKCILSWLKKKSGV